MEIGKTTPRTVPLDNEQKKTPQQRRSTMLEEKSVKEGMRNAYHAHTGSAFPTLTSKHWQAAGKLRKCGGGKKAQRPHVKKFPYSTRQFDQEKIPFRFLLHILRAKGSITDDASGVGFSCPLYCITIDY